MYEVVLAPLPGMSVQSGSQVLSEVKRWRYWYRVMLESSGLSQRSVTCALPASARKFSRKGLLTVPLTLIISATRVPVVKGPVELGTRNSSLSAMLQSGAGVASSAKPTVCHVPPPVSAMTQ